jgi:hypothetical protein
MLYYPFLIFKNIKIKFKEINNNIIMEPVNFITPEEVDQEREKSKEIIYKLIILKLNSELLKSNKARVFFIKDKEYFLILLNWD